MAFLRSNPMPVADHFLASGTLSAQRSGTVDGCGTTAASAAITGEVCEVCYGLFANQTELWKHARIEHGADRRLMCPKARCGRRFSVLAMSDAHAAHHLLAHVDRPLTCELCGRLLCNLRAFRSHVAKKHADAAAAVCGVCHLFLGDVPSLVDHVRRQHCNETTSVAGGIPRRPSGANSSQKPPHATGGDRGTTESVIGTAVRNQFSSERVETCNSRRDCSVDTTGLPATATSSATVQAVPEGIQSVTQIRHRTVIRCDVCGKRYGNYNNMNKHRMVHGTVEADLRNASVARVFPKLHKTTESRPY